MTNIELLEKKIFVLEMRIAAHRMEIEDINNRMQEMKDNKIIKSFPGVVVKAIEMASDITIDEIRSDSKKQELVYCRIIMANALAKAGFGPTKIGKILHRDHSSVVHLRGRFPFENSLSFLNLVGKYKLSLRVVCYPHKAE